MAVDYYKNKSQDHINLEELRFYKLLMAHRKANGLPDIPLSKGLSTTAGRHALDVVENFDTYPDSGHSWSDAPYVGSDPSTHPNSWKAPARLGTSYDGPGIAFNAYEIATGFAGTFHKTLTKTPDDAFDELSGSTLHEDVILNRGFWTEPWKAIGVGLYKGTANAWFGNSTDPGGPPVIKGTGADDTITATKFKDVVQGKSGDDVVKGGNGNDKLRGDGGDDVVDGGNGKDALNGGGGDDLVKGGTGKDTIAGDKGADVLVGGKYADKFVLSKTGDSTVGAAGRDSIQDLKQGQKDKIDLRRIDADTTEGGNQKFAFRGASKFGGDAGEVRFVQKKGDTFVYGDVDGDKKADFAILVEGSIDLTAGDFLL